MKGEGRRRDRRRKGDVNAGSFFSYHSLSMGKDGCLNVLIKQMRKEGMCVKQSGNTLHSFFIP